MQYKVLVIGQYYYKIMEVRSSRSGSSEYKIMVCGRCLRRRNVHVQCMKVKPPYGVLGTCLV